MSIYSSKRFSKLAIAGLFLMIFAFASFSVSAQTDQKCPLVISRISGDVSSFNITNLDPTELSISISASSPTVWGVLMVSSSTNANVYTSAVPVGSQSPVLVSATKIDYNLPASFSLMAVDSAKNSITIDVIANCPLPSKGCTFTQGYWKNHADRWPVNSLTLGNVSYNKNQLLSIFRTPVRGNGLVSLSHQLIAAKLNRAGGVSAPASIETAIAAADGLIGNRTVPPVGNSVLTTVLTSSLTTILDSYNNGRSTGGPPHCDSFSDVYEPVKSVDADKDQ